MTPTTISLFPSLPTRVANIGQMIAAVLVHWPIRDDDPAQWIVVCERDSVEDRRYSTHRLHRRDDQTHAEAGEYDLTYQEALSSLLARAYPGRRPGDTA